MGRETEANRLLAFLLAGPKSDSRHCSTSSRAGVDSVIRDSKLDGDKGPRVMKTVNPVRPSEAN